MIISPFLTGMFFVALTCLFLYILSVSIIGSKEHMKTYLDKIIYIKSSLKKYKARITPSSNSNNRVAIELYKQSKYLPFYYIRTAYFGVDVVLADPPREVASRIIRGIEDSIKKLEEEHSQVEGLEKALETESSIVDRLKHDQ